MRRFIVVAAALMFAGGALSGGEIGPPEPVSDGATPVSVSLGYSRYQGVFRASSNRYDLAGDGLREVPVQRQQLNLRTNVRIPGGFEAYLGAGVSTMENWTFADDQVVDDDVRWAENSFRRPYASAGFRGLFYDQGNVGVGPFVQASYFSNYSYFTPGTEKVQWRNMYDLVGGLSAQVAMQDALLYGGPMVYHSAAHLRVEDRGTGSGMFRQRYNEKGNIGAFAGMKLPLRASMSLGLEGRYRSDFSMGFSLAKAF